MNTIDSYFEYHVPIFKTMQVGNHPFITDVRENVEVGSNGDQYTTSGYSSKFLFKSHIMRTLLLIHISGQLIN